MDKRDEQIEKLEQKENSSLKQKLSSMEDRLQALENYQRRDNIILSGGEIHKLPADFDIKHAIRDLFRRTLKMEIPLSGIVKAH